MDKKCYIIDVDDVLFDSTKRFKECMPIDEVGVGTSIDNFNELHMNTIKPIKTSHKFANQLSSENVYLISACGLKPKVHKMRKEQIDKYFNNIDSDHIYLIEYSDSKNTYIKKIMDETNFEEYIFVDDSISRVIEAQTIPDLKVYFYNINNIEFSHSNIINITDLNQIKEK